MITFELLRAVCKQAPDEVLRAFVPHLRLAAGNAEIDTDGRVAAFVAQAAHESAEFTRLEENLNYSAEALLKTWPTRFITKQQADLYARRPEKIANFVYANRIGNGDEVSGDGFNFRGRGVFQLTGRANYRSASIAIAGNDWLLVNNPELVAMPEYAAETAAWYWESNHLNEFADSGDFALLTRKINGGTTGLRERTAYLYRAIEALK